MACTYLKRHSAIRVVAVALVSAALTVTAPAAHAAEPPEVLYTQSIGDHVPDVPSAAPQGQQGTSGKQPAPSSDLGGAAAQAAITAAITLLVQIVGCGIGFCVFTGF